MLYLKISCLCTVAVVFMVSTVSKLRSPSAFASFENSLSATKLLPTSTVPGVARTMVALELVVVPLLLVPETTIVGFSLSLVMLPVFSAGILWVWRRKSNVTCRCFGASKTPLGIRHVVRNTVLMGFAGGGAVAELALPSPGDLPGTLLAVGIGVVCALLLVTFDDLAQLFVPSPPPQSTRP